MFNCNCDYDYQKLDINDYVCDKHTKKYVGKIQKLYTIGSASYATVRGFEFDINVQTCQLLKITEFEAIFHVLSR